MGVVVVVVVVVLTLATGVMPGTGGKFVVAGAGVLLEAVWGNSSTFT